jgi:hypothetical protein
MAGTGLLQALRAFAMTGEDCGDGGNEIAALASLVRNDGGTRVMASAARPSRSRRGPGTARHGEPLTAVGGNVVEERASLGTPISRLAS